MCSEIWILPLPQPEEGGLCGEALSFLVQWIEIADAFHAFERVYTTNWGQGQEKILYIESFPCARGITLVYGNDFRGPLVAFLATVWGRTPVAHCLRVYGSFIFPNLILINRKGVFL